MLGFRGAAALFGALVVAAGAIAAACSIYDQSLLLPAPTDSGSDGIVPEAGAPDAREAEAGPPVCPLDVAPSRPAADDPSDAGDQTFVVALHTLNAGIGDAGVTGLGYDLDNVYTCCDGGAESCKAAQAGATHCDQSGGRDDSAGLLLQSLALVAGNAFNTNSVSQNLEKGLYSVLLQVQHYNGTPNDTSVAVSLYASTGVLSDAGAAWDGGDVWAINGSFSITDSGVPIPNHFDSNAYVSGGTLVLKVDFPLTLGASGTGAFDIDLTDGHITATVEQRGNGVYALTNGQIVGRWNVGQILYAVQALNLMGSNICPGNMAYAFVKAQVCKYADIMTDQMQDQMGQTCDALSLGIGYTADPASMGPIVQGVPHGSLCYPEGGAPDAMDNCQNP